RRCSRPRQPLRRLLTRGNPAHPRSAPSAPLARRIRLRANRPPARDRVGDPPNRAARSRRVRPPAAEPGQPDAWRRWRRQRGDDRMATTPDTGTGRSRGAPHRAPSHQDLLTRLHDHLTFLGLSHTTKHLDELLAWATRERPAPTALLEHVLAGEVASKRDARINRRFTISGLPERKTLEAFDWAFQPSLDKGAVVELGSLAFVERKEDLLITGKAGTGKSHILKAFGLRACQQGISMRYARCVDLLDDLHASLADGTYAKRLRAWARPALLIIDDIGLGQLKKRDDEPTAAHTLYNLVDRRH